MKNPEIKVIPINEIRVVNPRSRNSVTFQSIAASIGSVGLKKPITVYPRALADDGTRYDLVCGQGRLESVRALGEATIPAIMSDAPEDERYLMSLVENLARRQPSTTGLLHEVERLTRQHYKPATIAQKLGFDKSYIQGIVHLLRHGEERLIERVEAGRLPLELAIKITTSNDAEVQRALSDAYESGALRGTKLLAVQQLITRRKTGKPLRDANRSLSTQDLLREYERHTQQQRALVRRSAVINQRLALLASSLRRVTADDHFLTLLRAEGLERIPEHLAVRLAVPS